MRLINTDPERMALRDFLGTDIPPYAILSHCWGSVEDEVTFQQFQAGQNRDSSGHHKIVECCRIARSQGLNWAWIDTCCIDKTSSAELSESINSMFAWYRDAVVCYAFLENLNTRVEHSATTDKIPTINILPADSCLETPRPSAFDSETQNSDHASPDVVERGMARIPESWQSQAESFSLQRLPDGLTSNMSLLPTRGALSLDNVTADSAGNTTQQHVRATQLPITRWFQRGWTLQELLAPKQVYFFNSSLAYLGTRTAFATEIGEIAGIDVEYLNGETPLEQACVAQKMSWAASRQTTRSEDIAYCLLGLFDIQLPLLYGEGQKNAFRRLQEAIVAQSEDDSVFAWRSALPQVRGLLADSPSEFATSRRVRREPRLDLVLPYRVTNQGTELSCFISRPVLMDFLSLLWFPRQLSFRNISIKGAIRFLRETPRLKYFRVRETSLTLTCIELPPLDSPDAKSRPIALHLKTPWPVLLRYYHRWYRAETDTWASGSIRPRLHMIATNERFDPFRVTIFVSASNCSPGTSRRSPIKSSADWFRSLFFNMFIVMMCFVYWVLATQSSPVLPGIFLAIPALLILRGHFGTDPIWQIISLIFIFFFAVITDIFRVTQK